MRFLRRLFGREPRALPPRADHRGWNEDWQVGDLARCVVSVWVISDVSDPKEGDLLHVSELIEGPARGSYVTISGLRFREKPQTKAWHCAGFVKVRPSTTADEVETGIIEKIKRGARKGAGVDA